MRFEAGGPARTRRWGHPGTQRPRLKKHINSIRRIDAHGILLVAGIVLITFFAIGSARWVYVFDLARREDVFAAFLAEQWTYFVGCALFLAASCAAVVFLRRRPQIVIGLTISIPLLAAATYLGESVRNRGAQIHRFGDFGHVYCYATWWISGLWLLFIPCIIVLGIVAKKTGSKAGGQRWKGKGSVITQPEE